ncbi:MAG: mannonate dehydratase, partial [Planctomycetes bacterium]|nr:mannonate dehydratase [Planctomycetota bacterium]
MISLDDLPIRAGLGQFRDPTDEQLRFIKQCGVDDFLLNTPNLPGETKWEYADLAKLVETARNFGLRLMALENVPNTFWDKIMLGLPGREEQLTNICETVRNVGRAGIPILGYHFMPGGVWRTSRTTPALGGAQATSFNLRQATAASEKEIDEFTVSPSRSRFLDRELTDEQMW